MISAEPFALLVVLIAAVGLVAVLSNRLAYRLKLPSPALFLVGAASRPRSFLPCTSPRSRPSSEW